MQPLRNNIFYTSMCIFAISIGLVAVLFLDKIETHLYLNSLNSSWLDSFFSFMTHSVELYAILGLLILSLLRSYRITAIYVISFALTGLTTQFLKRVIFSENRRPYFYFKDDPEFHLVEGVKMLENFSFPSGHSSTALCMYFILALILVKPHWQVLCAILALLTAISRVYLSQHFLNDIVVGAALGLLITVLVNAYVERNVRWQWKLNGSLFRSISKGSS